MKRHYPVEHKMIAYELHNNLPEGIDNIPYTPAFDLIYKQFCERASADLDKNYVYCLMMYVRKHPEKDLSRS